MERASGPPAPSCATRRNVQRLRTAGASLYAGMDLHAQLPDEEALGTRMYASQFVLFVNARPSQSSAGCPASSTRRRCTLPTPFTSPAFSHWSSSPSRSSVHPVSVTGWDNGLSSPAHLWPLAFSTPASTSSSTTACKNPTASPPLSRYPPLVPTLLSHNPILHAQTLWTQAALTTPHARDLPPRIPPRQRSLLLLQQIGLT